MTKNEMKKEKHWIFYLVPLLAYSAGIIMASVGAIMLLSSGLKLYFFNHDPYMPMAEEQCRFEYQNRIFVSPQYGKVKEINIVKQEELKNPELAVKKETFMKNCIREKKQEEHERFWQQKMQNIIDGFASLLVGLLLVFFFRNKK